MGRTVFIVSRNHSDLYAYLKERFETDPAVDIILDRRFVQRRQRHAAHEVQRRRSERRRRPEIEVDLETRSHAILTLPDLVVD